MGNSPRKSNLKGKDSHRNSLHLKQRVRNSLETMRNLSPIGSLKMNKDSPQQQQTIQLGSGSKKQLNFKIDCIPVTLSKRAEVCTSKMAKEGSPRSSVDSNSNVQVSRAHISQNIKTNGMTHGTTLERAFSQTQSPNSIKIKAGTQTITEDRLTASPIGTVTEGPELLQDHQLIKADLPLSILGNSLIDARREVALFNTHEQVTTGSEEITASSFLNPNNQLKANF